MISKKIGTIFKENMKTKLWWGKLGIALIISNIFFFLLFGGSSEAVQETSLPQGWVEVQVNASLLTPFQQGKRVLLLHRQGRKKLEGILLMETSEQLGKITLLVKEDEAATLFRFENWEILPYLKNIHFTASTKEVGHEIHY